MKTEPQRKCYNCKHVTPSGYCNEWKKQVCHDNLCTKWKRRKNMSQEMFINVAKKIHGNKYDYSKVHFTKKNDKVCIICPEHGEFLMQVNIHLKGGQCPICRHNKQRLSNDEFIEKAKKIHGNKYDYSKTIYTTSKSKVTIICPEHGEFEQRAKDHLNGNGCPYCNRNLSKRMIYSYKIEYNMKKYIYVGLTYNVSVRHQQHVNPGKHQDSLYAFCNEIGINVPNYNVETDYIPAITAAKLEGEILLKYVSEGFIPINRMKTGGLGGGGGKFIKPKQKKNKEKSVFTPTLEECIENAKPFIDIGRTAWYKSNRNFYLYALKMGWIDLCCPRKKYYPPKNYYPKNCVPILAISKTKQQTDKHEFNSIGEATRFVLDCGLTTTCKQARKQIKKVLTGEQKSSYGYVWKYV